VCVHILSVVPEPFPGMAATAAAAAAEASSAAGSAHSHENIPGDNPASRGNNLDLDVDATGGEAGYLLIEAAGANGNMLLSTRACAPLSFSFSYFLFRLCFLRSSCALVFFFRHFPVFSNYKTLFHLLIQSFNLAFLLHVRMGFCVFFHIN